MAAAMGKDGWVSFGTTTEGLAYVDSWAINPSIGTADVTYYGASAKEFISTLREWTATISGSLDMSDTGQRDALGQFTTTGTSTTISLHLYDRTTCYFGGTVLLTGATINSQVGDKVSFTYNLQGTSNLSYTTS